MGTKQQPNLADSLLAWDAKRQVPAPTSTVAATPDTTADSLREKGNEKFKSGDFGGAEKLYSESLSKKEVIETLTNRALTRIKLGKFKEAETDCTRVLVLDSKNIKAYARRGSARNFLGAYELALQDFRRAQELEPTNTALRKERERTEALLEASKVAISPKPASIAIKAPVQEMAIPQTSSKVGISKATQRMKQPTPGASINNETLHAALQVIDGKLTVPSTSPRNLYAFVKVWRDLKGRKDLQFTLLTVTMTKSDYDACFGKSLEPDLFLEIIDALSGLQNEASHKAALNVIHVLSKLKSFELTRCFLSDLDKNKINAMVVNELGGGEPIV